MVQIHDKAILLMEFKSLIKVHGLNPWQFIYPKPNSHEQYQSPILIGNIDFFFFFWKKRETMVVSKHINYSKLEPPSEYP